MPCEKTFDFPSALILGFAIIIGRVENKNKTKACVYVICRLYMEKELDGDLGSDTYRNLYIWCSVFLSQIRLGVAELLTHFLCSVRGG